MTDVNLRSISGIFAHEKTIEQFLQPMIERAGGGGEWVGGCTGPMCRYFWVNCSELPYFCVGFFNSVMPFLGRFYQHLHIFCCILCVFHQKVKQCFGHKIFVMYN